MTRHQVVLRTAVLALSTGVLVSVSSGPAHASCAVRRAVAAHGFTETVINTAEHDRVATVVTDEGREVEVLGTPDGGLFGAGRTSVDRRYALGRPLAFHPLNRETPYRTTPARRRCTLPVPTWRRTRRPRRTGFRGFRAGCRSMSRPGQPATSYSAQPRHGRWPPSAQSSDGVTGAHGRPARRDSRHSRRPYCRRGKGSAGFGSRCPPEAITRRVVPIVGRVLGRVVRSVAAAIGSERYSSWRLTGRADTAACPRVDRAGVAIGWAVIAPVYAGVRCDDFQGRRPS
jgi:hypothetical protein